MYIYFHTWIVPEDPPRTRCRRSGGKILSRILFSCSFVALVGPWLLTTLAAAKETKKRFCDEAILQLKNVLIFTAQGMEGKSNGKLLEDHYSVIHQMLQIENYTIFVTKMLWNLRKLLSYGSWWNGYLMFWSEDNSIMALCLNIIIEQQLFPSSWTCSNNRNDWIA